MAESLSLFRHLLSREIFSRYLASAAGITWAFVLPLMLLGVYGFVFSFIFQARVAGDIPLPFAAWLAMAMWPWLAFSEALQRGSQSIVANSGLIDKVAIPRELFVLSATTAAFVLQFVGLLVILVFIKLAFGSILFSGIPLFLLMLASIYVGCIGLALALSAIQVYLRDLEHLLPTVLMMWFFLTPILYGPELIPERFRHLIYINPMASIMGRIREGLIFGAAPGLLDLLIFAGACCVLGGGLWIFRRLSPHFEDFL